MTFASLLRTPFFYRTPPAAFENNEPQQLSEGFPNNCYKIVSPILLQESVNDIDVFKHSSRTLLLVENVTSKYGFGN